MYQFLVLAALAHGPAHDRAIQFPDVAGYKTLVCDLHMHTVFSDGSVWPDIRVEEALRDGLDCVAVTEHLEYQPHSTDIPHPDRNRAYQVALERARGSDLVVLPGTEITRAMPPGHANALFIDDANPLAKKKLSAEQAWELAAEQGSFIFWNHPHWLAQRSDGMARLDTLHEEFIEKGWLQGIEVFNDDTWSDEALQIALDHNLAILATSDIHGLVDWQYSVPEGGHRPVTLVFAKQRSAEGIREALEGRRTVAWFGNTLVGRASELSPLIQASLKIADVRYESIYGRETQVLAIEVRNDSDARFLLRNTSSWTFHQAPDVMELAPHESTILRVKTMQRLGEVALSFEVLNALVAPKTHLTWSTTVRVPDEPRRRTEESP